MLAVICTLEDWQHYLKGLPHPFFIVTDHRNLEYWQTVCNLSCHQACWSLYLSRFDFQLTHKPGTANTQVDPLSCASTHQVTDMDNNQDQMVLQPKHFANAMTNPTEDSTTLEKDIQRVTDQDLEVTLTLRLLKEHRPRQLTENLTDWEE